jgi:hypothetical protein
MKTLVIHPPETSTDFLKPIYAGKNFTMLDDYRRFALQKYILAHERIILLGHGIEEGLFVNRGEFRISEKHPPLFADKEVICIRCFANDFFKQKFFLIIQKNLFVLECSFLKCWKLCSIK